MVVVRMVLLVFFVICITRLIFLDLIAYKEYKKSSVLPKIHILFNN